MEHTPTPWAIEECDGSIYSPEDKLPLFDTSCRTLEQCKIDGNFTIHAVNSHEYLEKENLKKAVEIKQLVETKDELVEALKKMVKYVQRQSDNKEMSVSIYIPHLEEAKKVLAKI